MSFSPLSSIIVSSVSTVYHVAEMAVSLPWTVASYLVDKIAQKQFESDEDEYYFEIPLSSRNVEVLLEQENIPPVLSSLKETVVESAIAEKEVLSPRFKEGLNELQFEMEL